MIPSAHGSPVNRGWGWNWTGRERSTGRIRTYFTRGSYGNKQELKDHLEFHFQQAVFIDGAPADREPTVLIPVQPELFQHGILKLVEAELNGGARVERISRNPLQRSVIRTLPGRIVRKPIHPAPLHPAPR